MSSSKSRKFKSKHNQNTKTRQIISKKIHLYFTYDEITEIRTILKTKNLMNVPLIIAATLLRKIPVIQQLIKDGYDINETGQNNANALIWAVKCKFLDIIDYLIENGANTAIETDNGDNIFTIALDSKLWDEESFIKLWQSVKDTKSIDINFTNKTGHGLVHMCVKRDWEHFLKILLIEQPNVNMANSNGVTPLMFACFRQNLNIVEILFNAGANPNEEDHHGRISLCYAISTKQCPNEITNRIIKEIVTTSSIYHYLKRRVELILVTAEKGEISCSASGMLLRSIQFSIQYLKNSLEILLNEQIFIKLQTTIKVTDSTKCLEFIIKIINEILFYNSDSIDYQWNLHKRLLEQFSNTYISNVCFDFLKSQNSSKISNLCLKTLVLSTSQYQQEIFDKNATILQNYIQDPALFDDEPFNRKEILQKKLLIMNEICRKSQKIHRKTLYDFKKHENRQKFEINSKQIKKRSKTYRNQSGKFCKQQILNVETMKREWHGDNPIVTSLQYLLQSDIDDNFELLSSRSDTNWPEWKKIIFQTDFNDYNRYQDLKIDKNLLAQSIICLKHSKSFNRNVMKALDIIQDYFTKIIETIIVKYSELWKIEQLQDDCNCRQKQEQTPWCYHKHTRNVDNYKRQIIHELQSNFKQLFENIRNLAQQNIGHCYQQINQLENLLLNHKIRGNEIMCHTTSYKCFLLKYTTINPQLTTNYVTEYIENVLNDHDTQLIQNIQIEISSNPSDEDNLINNNYYNPEDLYYMEMAQLSELKSKKNQCKQIESKQNTMANSYHLINSIISICDDNDS